MSERSPDSCAATAATIGALLERACTAAPHATFLVTETASYSYHQVSARTESTAAALAAAGVGRGERVVVKLTNSAEFLILFFATARLGAIFAPVNPACTPPELAGIVRQSKARLVVFEDVSPVDREAVASADVANVALAELARLTAPSQATIGAAAQPQDTALLISTSGSTSAPKLVAHSQASTVLGAEGFPAWLGLNGSDRLMTALPFFHSNALVYSTLGTMALGASIVVLKRFSASRFWDQTREFGATQFNLMGSMGEILMRRPELPNDADNPIRICYSAWSPPEPRFRAFERRFGLDMLVGYGLSESFYGTVWPLGEPKPFGTIGHLRQHPALGEINQARVVDEQGQAVGVGEAGTLLLRNPAIMQGYFGMDDASAAVIKDGWLNTGDIVRAEVSGVFTFVGRSKDIIRRSGENFAPIELEEALDAHPAVRMSAVVPVKSTLADDDAKAFVILESQADVTARELLEWCRERVARFKLPRYIEFVEELPTTHTTRVAKGSLSRERNSAEHDVEEFRRAASSVPQR